MLSVRGGGSDTNVSPGERCQVGCGGEWGVEGGWISLLNGDTRLWQKSVTSVKNTFNVRRSEKKRDVKWEQLDFSLKLRHRRLTLDHCHFQTILRCFSHWRWWRHANMMSLSDYFMKALSVVFATAAKNDKFPYCVDSSEVQKYVTISLWFCCL